MNTMSSRSTPHQRPQPRLRESGTHQPPDERMDELEGKPRARLRFQPIAPVNAAQMIQ